MKTLFVFRQDLRIEDNTGLIKAIQQSDFLLPVFVLDTTLAPSFGGFDDQRFLFLFDALRHLDGQLQAHGSRLLVLQGDPTNLLPKLAGFFDCDQVMANRSYDIYGIKRDGKIEEKLKEVCKKLSISDDYLLGDLSLIKPYKVFTPYFRAFIKTVPKYFPLQKVPPMPKLSLDEKALAMLKKNGSVDIYTDVSQQPHPYRPADGYAQRLHNLHVNDYQLYKDIPSQDYTSKLSVYTRFGLVSVRQIWNSIMQGTDEDEYPKIAFELGWRNFWHQLVYHEPRYFEQEVMEHRRNLGWQHNEKFLEAFEAGKTGYPLVDAGIRQLKAENRMHGRVRMVVASFLSKDILADWRRGEAFFKKYLLDYDEAVNVGNRQRAASVGADPKPLRIFSPMRQSQRFDPEAAYIRRYIPELSATPIKHIHDPINYPLVYAKPIFIHADRVVMAKAMYKGV